MVTLAAGDLDKRVRIERPVPDESIGGAGSGTWSEVATVWANLQDILPSRGRGESMADGINLTTRPARVRIRYRTDVTSAMRMVLLRWNGSAWVDSDRITQLTSAPAELGHRDGLEFTVEDYSPAGNPA